ncbi:MAG: 2-oxo acid dehydrogenase subunit E2 [Chloroflexi bacterium]|nr:2-oxo acid dehydrogenase subunit E2 [Chloroflexota bacterium]
MPQMGADMTEGTLVRWMKQVGDQVTRGDIIAEIETDKATVELEAFDSGVLRKHVVAEGETVPVGEVIAILGDASEAVPDVDRMPPAVTPARRVPEPVPTANGTEPPRQPAAAAVTPPANAGRLRISPVARRVAHEAGIDVTALVGSGPDGRILRRDVEAAAKGAASEPAAVAPAAAAPAPAVRRAAPAAAAATTEGLSKIRQATARRMTLSKQTQPHYYLTLDVDMTAAMEFRRALNASASEAQHVSVNDMVVKACALALQRHPKFNAEFSDQGLRLHEAINIDIGIALDEGLIAPALLDLAHKTLGTIAVESKDLVERAKHGRLRADEYSAGTFTITNLGAYGVESLIGIINPPQAAILGVGTVMAKPVVVGGEIAIRQVMKVALSADHRVSDGAEGARFIKEIQGLLENPVSLAL